MINQQVCTHVIIAMLELIIKFWWNKETKLFNSNSFAGSFMYLEKRGESTAVVI